MSLFFDRIELSLWSPDWQSCDSRILDRIANAGLYERRKNQLTNPRENTGCLPFRWANRSNHG